MRLEVRNIGLAAYCKMHECQLLEISPNKTFVFDSDRSYSDWQIEYSNSCCSKHDSILCDLRDMIRNVSN